MRHHQLFKEDDMAEARYAPSDPSDPIDPIDPTSCPTCRSGFQPTDPPYDDAIDPAY
jgi:hypothetical protein